MTEAQIIKAWNDNHHGYATLDRNPTGQDKVIIAKGNCVVVRDLKGKPVTEDLLNELWRELPLKRGY